MPTQADNPSFAITVDRSGVGEFAAGGLGGYEATIDRGRRRPTPVVTMSEDRHLDQTDRRKLIAGIRSLRRNFSVAAWMVRRHLDYNASFRFQARTGDDETNRKFEKLVKQASKPEKCHSRERFSLPRMLRMAELLRTVDGDCGWLKLASGQVQLIEGDRIRNPMGAKGFNRREWLNGVKVDAYGKPIQYAVHERIDGGSAFRFERTIPAKNMRLHGYFDREDQCRGISPMASAYNELQDVSEIHGLTLARTKVQSFFAVAFYRNADEAAGDLVGDVGACGDGVPDRAGYEVDFGGGPAVFDLDPGDKAEFLESGQPSNQMQSYVESVLLLALKALDLPYSFLREDFTNFFGSRGAWLLYDRACEPKREENRELLDDWTLWQATHWILSGDLVLPEGVTLSDEPWEWVPRKVPAFRRLEDIKADLLAMSAGLTTPEGVCREDDEGSFRENVQEIAQSLEYARSQGVQVSWDIVDNPDLPDDDDSEDPEEVPQKQGKRK